VAAVKRTPIRRKTRLRSTSDKRARLRASVQPVVDAVLARDGGCVLRGHQLSTGDCRGPDTPHHLRKAWRGWDWTLDNLVTLCAGHNGWVEDHPHEAHALGLVIRDGDTYADAWAAMLECRLPVGSHVAVCPGSGMPPRSEHHGYGSCPACRMIPTLDTPPDGGPGSVCAAHAWAPAL
jgi:hypothetical protein